MHRLRILGIFAALALLIAACGDPTPPAGTHALTVAVDGDGSGTVTFDASGETAVGTNNVAAGDVTLVATPEPGSVFDGWTGDACVGEGTTCTFTLDSDTTITATFLVEGDDTHTLTVATAGDGTGTVEFDVVGGDDAVGTHEIADGTEVTLVASATTGVFEGWTGGVCDGQGETCTFTMDADATVTANFNAPGGGSFDLTVAIEGDGTGTVTFDTAGGDNAVGTTTFDEGTLVKLVATVATGSFTGWSGDACIGQGVTCTFAISADTSVTANFSDAEPTSSSVAVNAARDDGWEWIDASSGDENHTPGTSYSEHSYNAMAYFSNYDAEVVMGFIFRDLGIPANAIIHSAHLEFTGVDRSGHVPTDGNDAHLLLRAEASLSPAEIPNEGTGNPITSRPRIGASEGAPDGLGIEWVETDDLAVGGTDTSVDFTELLQAIVDQDGWSVDSDTMIMVFNNDDTPDQGWRKIQSFEAGDPAVLHFSYSAP